jgi:hypothetical protein
MMHRLTTVALAGVFVASCGGSSSNPAGPGQTPTTTLAARPSPTPSATPEPATGLSCTVPPQPEALPCNIQRKAVGNVFRDQVIATIETIKREKPDWFDKEGNDRWRILVRDKYMHKFIEVLQRDYGLCANWAQVGLPRDEVSIKNSNDFNEQYDVIASGPTGEPYAWYSYEVTCKPAVF